MSFKLRPFSEVLALFKASNPKKKPKSFEGIHYAAQSAWSFGNLKQWPKSPPVTTLLQVDDPHRYDRDVLTKASALVSYANFGNAIGTWNAGGDARWVCGSGWILAEVELVQEQAGDDWGDDEGGGGGDYVDMLLAVWQLSDGWAAAVLETDKRGLAVSLMNLADWPSEGWQTERVWYGE
jgi:hypothetical protein